MSCVCFLFFLFTADVEPIIFSFRVKFYPADPFRMAGNGKIMLYQQLKRDLRHGRLYCSAGEAAALGALIVQGNFNLIQYGKFWNSNAHAKRSENVFH